MQHRPLFRPDIVQYFRVTFPDNTESAHAERHCIIAFLMPDRTGISGEECCMNVALILELTPN